MQKNLEAWEKILQVAGSRSKELVDDIIDVIEDELEHWGLPGELAQQFIDSVRERLNIPDDIGGDED